MPENQDPLRVLGNLENAKKIVREYYPLAKVERGVLLDGDEYSWVWIPPKPCDTNEEVWLAAAQRIRAVLFPPPPPPPPPAPAKPRWD